MNQGLVNQAQAPAQAQPGVPQVPPSVPPPDIAPPSEALQSNAPSDVADGEPNLTPEEQEAYDSALTMVGKLIHSDDKASDSIISQISKDDPAESIATVTSFLMGQVEKAFNGEVPETIVIPIVDEASDMLIELGEAKGLFTLDEKLFTKIKGNVIRVIGEDYGSDETQMQEMLQGVTSDDIGNMQKMFGEG
jgi:hypothetical protein